MMAIYVSFSECHYCQKQFELDDPAQNEHWRECEKHPAKAEIERLQAQLHEAKKIVKLVDKLVSDEVLYDDTEGDCTFCGAEAYEDGYHHEKGCWTNKLETALQLYKARVPVEDEE